MSRTKYLAAPEEWHRLHAYLLKQSEIGLDTEGVGYKDPGQKRVTVWSVAAFNGKQSPRGYSMATGYVLPVDALATFRPLLESATVRKWLHNAPADTGAIYDTTRIAMCNASCTLQYSRVAMPNLDSYRLKPLACKVLGKPYRPSYAEVMGYTKTWLESTWIKTKTCACGVDKCRKRLLPMHEKTEVATEVVTERSKPEEYRADDMHPPGHPGFISQELWDKWVDYALEDAVDALELASYLNGLKRQNPGDPYSEAVQAYARSDKWRD